MQVIGNIFAVHLVSSTFFFVHCPKESNKKKKLKTKTKQTKKTIIISKKQQKKNPLCVLAVGFSDVLVSIFYLLSFPMSFELRIQP